MLLVTGAFREMLGGGLCLQVKPIRWIFCNSTSVRVIVRFQSQHPFDTNRTRALGFNWGGGGLLKSRGMLGLRGKESCCVHISRVL